MDLFASKYKSSNLVKKNREPHKKAMNQKRDKSYAQGCESLEIKKIKLNRPGLGIRELTAEKKLSPKEWKRLLRMCS